MGTCMTCGDVLDKWGRCRCLTTADFSAYKAPSLEERQVAALESIAASLVKLATPPEWAGEALKGGEQVADILGAVKQPTWQRPGSEF